MAPVCNTPLITRSSLSLLLRVGIAANLYRHDDTRCYACAVYLAPTSLPNVIDRSAASLDATIVRNPPTKTSR